jgi:ribosomal protein L22
MTEEQKRIVEGGAAEPSDTGDEAADAKQAAGKEAAEEKAEAPKPKRPRRKKAEEPVADEVGGGGSQVAEEEPEAEEVPAQEAASEEDAAEEEKPSRRRRSADAAAAPKKTPAPRAADGTVVVRAQAKYVRHAPRKARLVVDHIRGKSVDEARAILNHTPRAAAVDVLKLLESAVANAENNHELDADDLVIRKVYVDEGPTLKRYRPRALGRATRIRKRTSHMTIQLSPKE